MNSDSETLPVPAASRNRTRERRLLLFVLVVAVLARLAGIYQFEDRKGVYGDERYYQRMATSIAAGEGHPGSVRPPLYPFVLAGLQAATGGDLAAVRLAQSLSSVLTVFLVFQLAARRFGTRSALLAGLVCALSPGLVYFSQFLWSESLNATLLALWLWLLDRFERDGSLRILAASGVVLGLCALTREMWLYAAALVGIWLLVRKGGSLRGAAPDIAVFGLALFVTIAPWTIRNFRLHDEFVLISTNRWFPIGIGNIYPADAWYLGTADRDRNIAIRRSPEMSDEFACQSYWREIALRRISADQPWWIFKKALRNTARLFEIQTQELRFVSMRILRPAKASALLLLAIDVIGTALTIIPAILGLWLLPDSRLRAVVVGTLLLWLGLHWAAVAVPRFHVALLPWMALYAGRVFAAPSELSKSFWPVAGATACIAIYVLVPLPLSVESWHEYFAAVDRLRR